MSVETYIKAFAAVGKLQVYSTHGQYVVRHQRFGSDVAHNTSDKDLLTALRDLLRFVNVQQPTVVVQPDESMLKPGDEFDPYLQTR